MRPNYRLIKIKQTSMVFTLETSAIAVAIARSTLRFPKDGSGRKTSKREDITLSPHLKRGGRH
jgi:hypothetical protein